MWASPTEKWCPRFVLLTSKLICIKSIFGSGFAPDLAGRDYGAPPEPTPLPLDAFNDLISVLVAVGTLFLA